MKPVLHPMTPTAMLPIRTAALCLPLLLLAACGGGGDASPPEATAPFDPVRLQGRWATPAGSAPATTAIVVPAGATSAQAWLLAQDATRLTRLTLDNRLGASGKSYVLGAADAAPTAVTGTYEARLDLNPAQLTVRGTTQAVGALQRADALEGAASLADAAGNWQASAGPAGMTWTIAGTGAIAGTSTTGCTYAGSASAPATVRVYTLAVTETCGTTATPMTGIATLSTDKSRLTLVATTADEGRAVAMFFARP